MNIEFLEQDIFIITRIFLTSTFYRGLVRALITSISCLVIPCKSFLYYGMEVVLIPNFCCFEKFPFRKTMI